MSIQLTLTAMGDFSEVEVKLAAAEARNEKITEMVDENEKRSLEAFQQSIGFMRASYQMIGGVAQVLGGGIGPVFSAIYGVGVASISLFMSIAQAQFFAPGQQLQSVMMMMSLVTALVSLGAVATGQKRLSQIVGGITQSLSGFGGMIDSFSI